jgi:hypothetical protein
MASDAQLAAHNNTHTGIAVGPRQGRHRQQPRHSGRVVPHLAPRGSAAAGDRLAEWGRGTVGCSAWWSAAGRQQDPQPRGQRDGVAPGRHALSHRRRAGQGAACAGPGLYTTQPAAHCVRACPGWQVVLWEVTKQPQPQPRSSAMEQGATITHAVWLAAGQEGAGTPSNSVMAYAACSPGSGSVTLKTLDLQGRSTVVQVGGGVCRCIPCGVCAGNRG